MIHSFISDNIKQDSATTAEHIKRIAYLLKIRKNIFYGLSNIWENTDGCAENYRCDTALYLLSILSQAFNITIDCGLVPYDILHLSNTGCIRKCSPGKMATIAPSSGRPEEPHRGACHHHHSLTWRWTTWSGIGCT